MKTVTYDIATGAKEDFYTLWRTTEVDLRPRDENGNVKENFRENAVGGNMYYHVHINFVQNLGKTKEVAKAKIVELGINVDLSQFDFDLKHLTKPSFEAFGVKMKFKGGKWYAPATKEFFDCWKANKQEMKNNGWSCWSYEDGRTRQTMWYMAIKLTD